ncbi:MAG: hypothetical protein DME75_13980 [Verrucomicrobia bacterium]|nr:MAG: hypothetical protein DME75_13980 [Verrucomicrobiota bacterium]
MAAALDFLFAFGGTRFMLGLIIARCCGKTRIDERIPMLTSQKVIDPPSRTLRRDECDPICLHRRNPR